MVVFLALLILFAWTAVVFVSGMTHGVNVYLAQQDLRRRRFEWMADYANGDAKLEDMPKE